MNNEFQDLISKFYDLSLEEKKEQINEEFKRIYDILNVISKFSKNPVSNDLVKYDSENTDDEDQNLTKIYNNLMVVEEMLIYYLKDSGY